MTNETRTPTTEERTRNTELERLFAEMPRGALIGYLNRIPREERTPGWETCMTWLERCMTETQP